LSYVPCRGHCGLSYLFNGGTIEAAQAIVAHETPRTTKLYNLTVDDITLDDTEWIGI